MSSVARLNGSNLKGSTIDADTLLGDSPRLRGRSREATTIDRTFRVKSLAMMADSCSQTAGQT